MAIGERIRYIRKLNGLKQRDLGVSVGFDDRSADIRIAQYESGARTPKAELVSDMAAALGVSERALNLPDIDSELGLLHTLFALEDTQGLTVTKEDGKISLRFDHSKSGSSAELYEMLFEWYDKKAELDSGEITKEEYDRWRYNYPNRPEVPKAVKAPKVERTALASAPAEEKAPTRTIDDILADIKANLEIMKNGQ